jgi:hypothetical protein
MPYNHLHHKGLSHYTHFLRCFSFAVGEIRGFPHPVAAKISSCPHLSVLNISFTWLVTNVNRQTVIWDINQVTRSWSRRPLINIITSTSKPRGRFCRKRPPPKLSEGLHLEADLPASARGRNNRCYVDYCGRITAEYIRQ